MEFIGVDAVVHRQVVFGRWMPTTRGTGKVSNKTISAKYVEPQFTINGARHFGITQKWAKCEAIQLSET